jgi:hypothetical protein
VVVLEAVSFDGQPLVENEIRPSDALDVDLGLHVVAEQMDIHPQTALQRGTCEFVHVGDRLPERGRARALRRTRHRLKSLQGQHVLDILRCEATRVHPHPDQALAGSARHRDIDQLRSRVQVQPVEARGGPVGDNAVQVDGCHQRGVGAPE